jgi:hypothetical protein
MVAGVGAPFTQNGRWYVRTENGRTVPFTPYPGTDPLADFNAGKWDEAKTGHIGAPAPPTTTDSGISPQLLSLLSGPTAYSPMIRDNLGLDVQWGGKRPTSGMAASAPKISGYGPLKVQQYKPRAAKADPIVPIIPRAPPVTAPTTPTTTSPTTPAPTTSTRGDPNNVIMALAEAMRRNRRSR